MLWWLFSDQLKSFKQLMSKVNQLLTIQLDASLSCVFIVVVLVVAVFIVTVFFITVIIAAILVLGCHLFWLFWTADQNVDNWPADWPLSTLVLLPFPVNEYATFSQQQPPFVDVFVASIFIMSTESYFWPQLAMAVSPHLLTPNWVFKNQNCCFHPFSWLLFVPPFIIIITIVTILSFTITCTIATSMQ